MADRAGGVISGPFGCSCAMLLFWVPATGPLIAEYVGGKKAGSAGRAILAAIIPALIKGGIMFFSAWLLTALPLFGFVTGAGGFALMVVHVLPRIFGAAIGTLI